MIEIEKKLKKFFRDNPVHEDKPKLRSGKLPISQLYKVLGETGKEDLKAYINKEEAKEKLSATKATAEPTETAAGSAKATAEPAGSAKATAEPAETTAG